MIGRFPSLKLGRMVAFESLIEQDYVYVLDYEPDVIGFEEQPFSIQYDWQGKWHKYTPDFHVIRDTRHEIVECKPQALVTSDENQKKFMVAQRWCRERGWTLVVVTDLELRTGPRLANIKLLTRYARMEVAPEIHHQAKEILADLSKPHLLFETGCHIDPHDPRRGVGVLLHLAYHHRIQITLSKAPISDHSQIWLAEEKKI